MTAYIVRRLIATIPVVVLVAIIVFMLVHLAPGDPASIIAGDNATSDQIARIRATLGLDEPLWKQFAIWFSQVLRGDLGTSLFWNQPVSELIRQRAEPTISLAITTILTAVVISITLGVLAAWKAGSALDRSVMA
ncbi:MAG: ABC transporter permease, partial [Acetobacteraceae bacterium]|nr:ABC transporter permease [Acetobacteraceae bacterium]